MNKAAWQKRLFMPSPRGFAFAGQQEDDLRLDRISVLKLIHEHASEPFGAASRTRDRGEDVARQVEKVVEIENRRVALECFEARHQFVSSAEKLLMIAVAIFPTSSRNAAAQAS